MSDGFDEMVAHSRSFLAELAENNDRAWFDAHKQVFKTEIEAPAKLLTTLFEEDPSRMIGAGHEGKMGRIYRDARFPKDKTPYNTYLHCYWRGGGQKGNDAAARVCGSWLGDRPISYCTSIPAARPPIFWSTAFPESGLS